MDRPLKYLFPFVDDESIRDWLDTKTNYSIIKEQGLPKWFCLDKQEATLYRLKWTKNGN